MLAPTTDRRPHRRTDPTQPRRPRGHRAKSKRNLRTLQLWALTFGLSTAFSTSKTMLAWISQNLMDKDTRITFDANGRQLLVNWGAKLGFSYRHVQQQFSPKYEKKNTECCDEQAPLLLRGTIVVRMLFLCPGLAGEAERQLIKDGWPTHAVRNILLIADALGKGGDDPTAAAKLRTCLTDVENTHLAQQVASARGSQ